MKIQSLNMKNFKNIKESTIEFKDKLSGIYGPNGTGKTAVIEAIEIITIYFDSMRSNSIRENLIIKLNNLIKIGENSMEIEVQFVDKEYIYKLGVLFKRDNFENIYVEKEYLLYKKISSRAGYKAIAMVQNNPEDIVPLLYFQNRKSLVVQEIMEKIKINTNINEKSLLFEFAKLKSYLALVYDQVITLNREELKGEVLEFFDNFKKIKEAMMLIMVVTLKEQALYNLELIIPIKAHLEDVHGTFAINFGKNKSNIYDENIVEILDKIICQIGDIFSVIVPGTKLILEKRSEKIEENSKKIAVSLYVEREGSKINIENESTGTIKLISLLSALIYYVQDEEAIVLIDELDVHIFEYLLAILLEKLAKYAKGQLIFTAHNLLPMEKLNRKSIIISTIKNGDTSYTYFKGTSGSTNFRQKYLRSQNLWSEDNISPLMLNRSALDLYLRKLVN